MNNKSCTSRHQRVMDYIERNLGKKITIRHLADAACVSVYHFTRGFKRHTGKTPMRLIFEARVECAKGKLRLGMAISDVAVACGFASQSHLTTVFRSQTGSTPAKYQRDVVSPPK